MSKRTTWLTVTEAATMLQCSRQNVLDAIARYQRGRPWNRNMRRGLRATMGPERTTDIYTKRIWYVSETDLIAYATRRSTRKRATDSEPEPDTIDLRA